MSAQIKISTLRMLRAGLPMTLNSAWTIFVAKYFHPSRKELFALGATFAVSLAMAWKDAEDEGRLEVLEVQAIRRDVNGGGK